MVPFLDLKAQYDQIELEIRTALEKVCQSSSFVLGPAVNSFESEFAQYCGVRHAAGVNSGTSALHLALLAADVKPGDEVITSPLTFVATVAAIRYCGAKAVYVDAEEDHLTLDPALLEDAITPRTKAIVPVHLHGQTADMDPIVEIARRKGVMVIEDAAQAHGAAYHGKRAGSLGDLACFSFYPGKNLGAYGEGGAVVSDRQKCIEAVQCMRDWGQTEKYHHDMIGFNYRMEGFQGAVLGVKLPYMDAWNNARQQHASSYDQGLSGHELRLPKVRFGCEHVYHVYAVRHRKRDRLQKRLNQRGIHTGIHYPIPVHLQKAYADPTYGPGDFPVAEKACQELLSLPMYPQLTPDQISEVIDTLSEEIQHL